jgi:thymidylate synthase (FAD)
VSAKLIWITPDADNMVAYCARVSNPANQRNTETAPKLIRYCIRNRHWSVLEMANACVEIETTRDIGRQLLRHRSFSFQEFSQRYQTVDKLSVAPLREARMQYPTNRQASVPCEDAELLRWWEHEQQVARGNCLAIYENAIARGIAKEVARCVLPEGMTSTRLYMNGTLRSWLHFLDVRLGHGTQPETVAIAEAVRDVLREACPVVMEAWEERA